MSHNKQQKAAIKDISKVDLMLMVMSFIWGLNFTVIKSAMRYFSPMPFNALRFTIASALLLVFLKIREKSISIRREDLKSFILLALIGNSLYQALFINGIYRTTAGNSSLLLATTPIFVALISYALNIEKIAKRVWQGIFLSFVGIALLILGSERTVAFALQNIIGDLLILAGTICWSIYTVLSRPMLQRYSSLKLTALTIAIGTPPIIIFAIPSLNIQNWSSIPVEAWTGLAYSAVLAIALGYTIWYTGVSQIGSARTSIYEYLITLIAIATAWILLSEIMTLIQIAGAVLVLIGLYLSRK